MKKYVHTLTKIIAQTSALMTAVTSIVLPINAEIDGNNLNVFKRKSFQFNMDKAYLTSSNFIAERVKSMHDSLYQVTTCLFMVVPVSEKLRALMF